MAELFNIYCDESCHLENDNIPVMVLGAVWCLHDRVKEVSCRVRDLKKRYGLLDQNELRGTTDEPFEIKWSKVSESKKDFYLALVDYFFDDDDLHFRGIIIDKRRLNHAVFMQTHDTWYYKMIFRLVEPVVNPEHNYNIYLDIKDTRSEVKRSKLEGVLRNTRYDPRGVIVRRVQQIRSNESEIMQLTDLIMGAIAYHNRRQWGDLRECKTLNTGKLNVVYRIQERSGTSLLSTTWLREPKLNILRWEPRD